MNWRFYLRPASLVNPVWPKLLFKGFAFPLRKGNAGFTLVEVLVVFSVVAIISGIGVASLAAYGRSQQVNQTASDIKLLINQARFNSLSAVKSDQDQGGDNVSCGANSLLGYSILRQNTTTLDLNLECEGQSAQRIKRLRLPDNLLFDTGTTCSTIRFDTLTATASGVPCIFTVEGFGQTKTISIDATGNISIE